MEHDIPRFQITIPSNPSMQGEFFAKIGGKVFSGDVTNYMPPSGRAGPSVSLTTMSAEGSALLAGLYGQSPTPTAFMTEFTEIRGNETFKHNWAMIIHTISNVNRDGVLVRMVPIGSPVTVVHWSQGGNGAACGESENGTYIDPDFGNVNCERCKDRYKTWMRFAANSPVEGLHGDCRAFGDVRPVHWSYGGAPACGAAGMVDMDGAKTTCDDCREMWLKSLRVPVGSLLHKYVIDPYEKARSLGVIAASEREAFVAGWLSGRAEITRHDVDQEAASEALGRYRNSIVSTARSDSPKVFGTPQQEYEEGVRLLKISNRLREKAERERDQLKFRFLCLLVLVIATVFFVLSPLFFASLRMVLIDGLTTISPN